MNKVLIPTKLSDVAANTLKTAGYEVVQDADTPLEEQAAAHPDTVALIVRSEKVTPAIMDALPSLKLVIRAGAGDRHQAGLALGDLVVSRTPTLGSVMAKTADGQHDQPRIEVVQPLR